MEISHCLRRGRARTSLSVAAACILIGAVVFSAPAKAETVTETSVSVVSDPGAWAVTGEITGAHRFFHPGNATISIAGGLNDVSVGVNSEDGWNIANFNFTAPPFGTGRLEVGDYEGVWDNSFEHTAGLKLAESCSNAEGRFKIKRITTAPDGTVNSLWVVFEHHCRGRMPAVFGEIRYEVPRELGKALVAPRHIRWPVVANPGAPSVVPITVVNRSSASLSMDNSYLTGPDQNAFSIVADECAGRVLGETETCVVQVRFGAEAPDAEATLVVPEKGGPDHQIDLEGSIFPGTTRFIMNSEKRDYIGRGKQREYTPANSSITADAWGNGQGVLTEIIGLDHRYWVAAVAAPDGSVLTAGKTYRVTRRSLSGGWGPAMDISGNNRKCTNALGKFTMTAIEFDAEGELREARIEYEQHCDGRKAALTGVLEYRFDP